MEVKRFAILPSSVGFEIIDAETGHPVDTHLTAREAVEEAGALNRAAEAGSRALAVALTGLSDPSVYYDAKARADATA